MVDVSTRRRLAQDLIDIGAVSLAPDQPFTWASGLLSPVYCDNRMTLGHPSVRRRIRDAFVETIREHALKPDVLAGTATAGIPHAAWLAEALGLPMTYVRSKPKEHGKGSQIEGPLDAGQHVVVIEDLVSTGGSSIGAVEALQSAGAAVEAVLAIFSYGLEAADDAFAAAGVPLYTLTDFTQLMSVAKAGGRLDEEGAASIAEWRRDPWAWTEARKAKTSEPSECAR